MPIYILGIYSAHNATAALLKDGEIIACVSEERFNGKKNYVGFPKQSIKWCLDYAGISPQDLSLVVLSFAFSSPEFMPGEIRKNIGSSILLLAYSIVNFVRTNWGQTVVYNFPRLRGIGTFLHNFTLSIVGRYVMKKEKKYISSYLNISESKILNFDHHLSHAATAYYASPFNQDEVLAFSLDAEGDGKCASVNIFNKDKILTLAITSRENSFGWLYVYVTRFLGMKGGEDEYKVMGLAPYAKKLSVEKVFNKIKSIITLDPKNPLKFKSKFNTQDTAFYLKKEMMGVRFDNLAGAFQKLTEDRMTEWVKAAINKTKISTIVCAGGVFMNVKANKKISELKEVQRCFFMPSSGDESIPIGGCYLGYLQLIKKLKLNYNIKPIKDLYLGPKFSENEIKEFLNTKKYFEKYHIEKINSIEKKIAKLLAEGYVVARVFGRMEWGARALGNRSILANPSMRDIVMEINEQMKKRDFWMPFAPSILYERKDDYCIIKKNFDSPYMNLSFDSTELAKKELRAAMHSYDFTLRPQFVRKDWNPRYYKLIKEFEKLTGIGGVLNTSFNLHGLPIVLGLKEAMFAFQNSELKYLAIEDFLVSKKTNSRK